MDLLTSTPTNIIDDASEENLETVPGTPTDVAPLHAPLSMGEDIHVYHRDCDSMPSRALFRDKGHEASKPTDTSHVLEAPLATEVFCDRLDPTGVGFRHDSRTGWWVLSDHQQQPSAASPFGKEDTEKTQEEHEELVEEMDGADGGENKANPDEGRDGSFTSSLPLTPAPPHWPVPSIDSRVYVEDVSTPVFVYKTKTTIFTTVRIVRTTWKEFVYPSGHVEWIPVLVQEHSEVREKKKCRRGGRKRRERRNGLAWAAASSSSSSSSSPSASISSSSSSCCTPAAQQ